MSFNVASFWENIQARHPDSLIQGLSWLSFSPWQLRCREKEPLQMHPSMFDFFSPLAKPRCSCTQRVAHQFCSNLHWNVLFKHMHNYMHIKLYTYVCGTYNWACSNSCVVLRVGFNFFLPSSKVTRATPRCREELKGLRILQRWKNVLNNGEECIEMSSNWKDKTSMCKQSSE